MKFLNILIVMFLSFFIYSCEKDSENEKSSCFQIDFNETKDYNIENSWILLGFMFKDNQIEDCKPTSLGEMNIEFGDNNRFQAKSSCNYFNGYYIISDPDSIKVDSLMTTLKFCNNDIVREWEVKYFTGLMNATNFNIIGNRLKIITKTDYDLILRVELNSN